MYCKTLAPAYNLTLFLVIVLPLALLVPTVQRSNGSRCRLSPGLKSSRL